MKRVLCVLAVVVGLLVASTALPPRPLRAQQSPATMPPPYVCAHWPDTGGFTGGDGLSYQPLTSFFGGLTCWDFETYQQWIWAHAVPGGPGVWVRVSFKAVP